MKWRAIHFTAIILIIVFCSLTFPGRAKSTESLSYSVNTGLYRVFELEVINNTVYDNKFTDVELTATYTSPSGKIYNFPGFYDGDGNGDGNYQNGNVWKLRFMPNELGEWTYEYSWSDTTTGDSGTINCISEGAGKGMLQPYKDNPRWFAYNGTDPVWIKSYYETGHGALGQNIDWIVENVYSRMVDAGYNHLQVNWLLSLCCFQQYYLDGPAPEISDMTLYQNGMPYTTMKFDIWYRMERHLSWLNDHDVGVHMFLGVEGGKNDGPAWDALSSGEKEWFTKYIVARLAPFANLAGWNFVWEVPGDRENYELGFTRLIQKYDIFNHLRTYEDEAPREHEYQREEYNFAAIENHYIHSWDRNVDRPLWKEPWTHHKACLMGYVPGKPVYMSEGNALWRRFWQERLGTTRDQLRQAAWACATGGASFNWNGHAGEYDLYAYGSTGLPFNCDDNEYKESEEHISILTKVMNEEIVFYKMNPQDDLLSQHDPLEVWALAETGKQYLVFSTRGESFSLSLSEGNYENNVWLDAKTGAKTSINDSNITTTPTEVSFVPPNNTTDWVLILRTGDITAVDEGSNTQNSNMDHLPNDFILYQNFPNPFNSQTTIQYELLKSDFIELTIHDVNGNKIDVLENGFKHAGKHKVFWNMEGTASGIYYYKLKVGNTVKVKKIAALK